MLRKWDVQWCWNPWLSVGFHFDHTDPGLTFHLPGVIISIGRLKQPGFRTVGNNQCYSGPLTRFCYRDMHDDCDGIATYGWMPSWPCTCECHATIRGAKDD